MPLVPWFPAAAALAQEAPPVELKLAPVARPTAGKQPAAQKINDLYLYEGRLYVGHGDYGVNTGPTDVIVYDPATKQLRTEFTVDDEAIVLYREIGGQLVIPGPDATEDWTLGNVYVRAPGAEGAWAKRRTLPSAVHVLDVAAAKDSWIAGTGVVANLAGPEDEANQLALGAILASSDQGATWTVRYATGFSTGAVNRIASIVVFRDRVLAFPLSFGQVAPERLSAEMRAKLKPPPEGAGYTVFFPDVLGDGLEAVEQIGDEWRAVDVVPVEDVVNVPQAFVFADRLVLAVISGRTVPSGSHYDVKKDAALPGVSRGLWAWDGAEARQLPVPFDSLKDVVVRDGRLHLLVLRSGRFEIGSTADLEAWTWRALPASEADPLSIEASGADFYVGYSDGALMLASEPSASKKRARR